jgi:hypothetical protein
MRTSLLLSIVLGVATGACSQSLAPNMTGTGGAGTGAGDQGGSSNFGAGGSGANDGAICNTLTAEYQSAVTAAESCQVGASGQCQQIVIGNLSGCSCSTYVTDSSALTTIREAWDAAGCVPVAPPCVSDCPVALNTTCVSTDGGSAGFCSYVPGTGGGGASGTSGAGGSSQPPSDGGLDVCGTLASEYAAVFVGAKSCMVGAGVQCATSVPVSLAPCAGCTDYVNDSSVLDAIRQKWDAAGCGNAKVLCPQIACPQPRGARCASSDAGGSVCTTVF